MKHSFTTKTLVAWEASTRTQVLFSISASYSAYMDAFHLGFERAWEIVAGSYLLRTEEYARYFGLNTHAFAFITVGWVGSGTWSGTNGCEIGIRGVEKEECGKLWDILWLESGKYRCRGKEEEDEKDEEELEEGRKS